MSANRPVRTAAHPKGWVLDGEAHDRDLIRQMLRLTPTQRLRTLSNWWPIVQAGRRRRGMDGDR